MSRTAGHFEPTARRILDGEPFADPLPLTTIAYPLAFYGKKAEDDDAPFNGSVGGLYIVVDLPGGDKKVEVFLTIEQLSEALLGAIRSRNRPGVADHNVQVLDLAFLP